MEPTNEVILRLQDKEGYTILPDDIDLTDFLKKSNKREEDYDLPLGDPF